MSTNDLEGVLYYEVNKVYEETYICATGRKVQVFKKSRSNLPASASNKGELAVQFEILANACECKVIKYGLADLSKIMKASKLTETPYFFSVTLYDKVYMFAAHNEDDRSSWTKYIKNTTRMKERKTDSWMNNGFMDGGYPAESTNQFGGSSAASSSPISNRAGMRPDKTPEEMRKSLSKSKRKSLSDTLEKEDSTSNNNNNSSSNNNNRASVNMEKDKEDEDVSSKAKNVFEDFDDGEENTQGSNNSCTKCLYSHDTFMGMKIDSFVRLFKVGLAFPFVIVVSSLNLSTKYSFLRSIAGIRIMNILMYVAPVVYVQFVLSQFDNTAVQRIAIGFYILIYLFPVAYVVFSKVKVSSSTSRIEEGTFCFKPARTVRFTQANFYALFGFVMEWMQHVLYVLPLGIVTGDKAAKLSDFPPYLDFKVYFWIAVISTFICGLIIILNTVLRGKIHYRFQRSYVVWFFLYNVGSPMFVTVITILFMSLWCDYESSPPSLLQQPSIECYSSEHIVMARAALIAFAVYIIQHTLLPSGTFKETMRDNDLEIMFVPVYLQAHYLLKAVFCGFYVYFYEDNFTRVIVLSIINMLLLALNNFMKPCSVGWVNLLRDCFFVHASLSGIISLNYLGFPENYSTKGMVISTLASTVLFSTVGMYVYYKYTARSTEYTIASAFLDLEWQVSRGGSVHPRVLEPLISLTLSSEKEDWEIAKNYISKLVWLISYPNRRVQFQSAWGLANLALLDEDARIQIFKAEGLEALFGWYTEMDFVVQLEALAALANLTLSMTIAEEMVSKYRCIPFFIELVSSNKMKHSQFAAIALANLARKEAFRELIRKHGGIPALLSCIMSHDYQKRRHGCRALANVALSPSKDIEQVFESKGLIDRILKMAMRKEIETQQEVVALIRNLACHARLRPLLLDRGVMAAVEASKLSVYQEVKDWCEEITQLLEREITTGAIDLKALMRREGAKGNTVGETDVELLKRMEPLKACVEWSTWGSKLENIFEPVFSTIPTLVSSNVTTNMDEPITCFLPVGMSKPDLHRWRDSLSFAVAERPSHGKLNEYNTTSNNVVYTPSPGYIGTDFFSYRMMVGSILTAPVTIAITIVDPANPQAGDNSGNKKGKKNRKKAPVDEEPDLEQGSVAAESTANSYSVVSGGRNSSPNKRATTGGTSRNKNDVVEVEMVEYEESKSGGQRKPHGSSGSNNNSGGLFSSMTKKSGGKHEDREDL